MSKKKDAANAEEKNKVRPGSCMRGGQGSIGLDGLPVEDGVWKFKSYRNHRKKGTTVDRRKIEDLIQFRL
jgi:hypothetical protein